jgi:hypothetical protein
MTRRRGLILRIQSSLQDAKAMAVAAAARADTALMPDCGAINAQQVIVDGVQSTYGEHHHSQS